MKNSKTNYGKIRNRFSGNLVVFCSDERFVEPSLKFIKDFLKIKRCDLIALPGGPAFIVKDESNLMERLSLLIKAHKIHQIILISHIDCGYYKKYFGDILEEILRYRTSSSPVC